MAVGEGWAVRFFASQAASASPWALTDIIVLGTVVSLTGKYVQNGPNTRNDYDCHPQDRRERRHTVDGGPYKLQIRLLRRRIDTELAEH
jgi:hypothetical protein